MKAITYGRVSSDDQREAGTIELQRYTFERWCEREGVTLVRSYEDDGVSGTIMFPERPGGAQLLRDLPELRKQGVSLLLVYNWSRLGREPWVVWGAIYDLEKQGGLRLKSITEEADTSSPERILMLCVGTGVASMERARFIQVSREATNRWASHGYWVGGVPPYGYQTIPDGKRWRLEVDESPLPGVDPAFGLSWAEVPRRIFAWCAEGEGLVLICRRLNALGIPPAKRVRAPIWQPARLRDLIVNPVYRGEHHYGREPVRGSSRPREIITRTVPALVSPELWQAAQDTLQRNKSLAQRNAKYDYLLRGLVRCVYCNYSYSGRMLRDREGSEVRYYRCVGANQRAKPRETWCRAPYANADVLEALVWGKLERLIRHPEELLLLIQQERQREISQAAHLALQLDPLREALAEREAQRAKVIRWARTGLITEVDLAQELAGIAQEEASLRDELARLEPQVQAATVSEAKLHTVQETLRSLQRGVDNYTWDERRQAVLDLVERIGVEVTGSKYYRNIEAHIKLRGIG